jgi:hypothetical protein
MSSKAGDTHSCVSVTALLLLYCYCCTVCPPEEDAATLCRTDCCWNYQAFLSCITPVCSSVVCIAPSPHYGSTGFSLPVATALACCSNPLPNKVLRCCMCSPQCSFARHLHDAPCQCLEVTNHHRGYRSNQSHTAHSLSTA